MLSVVMPPRAAQQLRALSLLTAAYRERPNCRRQWMPMPAIKAEARRVGSKAGQDTQHSPRTPGQSVNQPGNSVLPPFVEKHISAMRPDASPYTLT